MTLKKFTMICLAIVTFGSLAACGGSDVVTQQTSPTTMGQELQDLDASFKAGIITEKQYKRAKDDILDKYDR
jgi:hypothetical protein